MNIRKPDEILRCLLDAGFAAYYVGGCVRDTLLGRSIHDWDVATSARPEQITALFSHCVPTGMQHGTVTVLFGETQAEVTSFRRETGYCDSRHPDSVQFVTDLQSDLARRDFTVNAMAMDLDGRITDLFGGRDDLARGVIRCVGNPGRRFGEDAPLVNAGGGEHLLHLGGEAFPVSDDGFGGLFLNQPQQPGNLRHPHILLVAQR